MSGNRPNQKRFREQLTARDIPRTEGEPAPEPAARDDAADQAALDALRVEAETPIAAQPMNGHAAAEVFPAPDPERAEPAYFFQQDGSFAVVGSTAPPPQPPPPAQEPTNLFLHGYRQLTPPQGLALRAVKDLALMLFRQLHALEGSPLDDPDFASRELQQAGLRLEEAMLWVEKHFNV